jgi:hypothetical protein
MSKIGRGPLYFGQLMLPLLFGAYACDPLLGPDSIAGGHPVGEGGMKPSKKLGKGYSLLHLFFFHDSNSKNMEESYKSRLATSILPCKKICGTDQFNVWCKENISHRRQFKKSLFFVLKILKKGIRSIWVLVCNIFLF